MNTEQELFTSMPLSYVEKLSVIALTAELFDKFKDAVGNSSVISETDKIKYFKVVLYWQKQIKLKHVKINKEMVENLDKLEPTEYIKTFIAMHDKNPAQYIPNKEQTK